MVGPKLPPPPARAGNGAHAAPVAAQTSAPAGDRFSIVSGRQSGAQRVLLYGPGGIGKSTLAALAPNPVFIDLEGGTRALDVPRIAGVETYADLRACLQSDALDGFGTIIIDSATKAEEITIPHVLMTVPHEKGHRVNSMEGYGFSKGLGHAYDAFLLILSDLDRQIRQGRNVILIAHDCIADAPNPVGEDFIRYEPHLQSPKSGKASIRNRVVQWADHVLFIGYDVIAKDGKGQGSGTRTIWPVERPDHVAKSRSLSEPLPFERGDGSVWNLICAQGGVS